MKSRRYGLRYTSGLLIMTGGVIYISMMVWRYVVPFAYRRTYTYPSAEAVAVLCISFIVLGAVALLVWVTDYFAREAWGVNTWKYERLTRYFGRVRTWCDVGMILAAAWAVMWLWPLF